MDIATIALIAAAVWVSLLVIVIALCRIAGRADAHSDRLAASL
jgi:hypothetical protein